MLAVALLEQAAAAALNAILFSCYASEIIALEVAVFRLKSLKSKIFHLFSDLILGAAVHMLNIYVQLYTTYVMVTIVRTFSLTFPDRNL